MRWRTQPLFGAAPGLKEAPVTWALIGINVAVWIAMEATGGSESSRNLLRWGAKDGLAILHGDWWRLITPIFLHIGFFHLLANSFGLIVFGGTVERVYGSAAYAAIYILSGVLGNVASFWASPALGAGASGAVFGIVGAFAVYLMLNRRVLGRLGSQALTSIGFIIVINLLFGFLVAGIDNWAHLGGLAGGAAMAWALAPRQRVAAPGPESFRIGPLVRTEEVRPGPAQQAAVIGMASVVIGLLAYAARLAY